MKQCIINSIINTDIEILFGKNIIAREIERVYEYGQLSALMVNDYWKKRKQPLFPFYFVQLTFSDTAKRKSVLWPQFRDQQRKMLTAIFYSGRVVRSDIGFKDGAHPTNKKDVGHRLAIWVLNKTYGKKISHLILWCKKQFIKMGSR